DPSVGWSVDVLLVRKDHSADVKPMTLAAARGSLLLDGLTDYDRAVLVVTNLSNGQHYANTANCSAGTTFTYELKRADLAEPPVVDGVDPNQLAIGQSH